jgi:hypothetical protein
VTIGNMQPRASALATVSAVTSEGDLRLRGLSGNAESTREGRATRPLREAAEAEARVRFVRMEIEETTTNGATFHPGSGFLALLGARDAAHAHPVGLRCTATAVVGRISALLRRFAAP